VEFNQLRSNALAIAQSNDWVREHGGDNKGEVVEHFLKGTGLGPGYPWCASFVSFVGKATMGTDWPLPLSASVMALHDAAVKKGLLTSEPKPGDIFLLWFTSKNRFAHTGFIVEKDGDKWHVIEGNAADPSKPSSRNGWGVFHRRRTFSDKDRFISW